MNRQLLSRYALRHRCLYRTLRYLGLHLPVSFICAFEGRAAHADRTMALRSRPGFTSSRPRCLESRLSCSPWESSCWSWGQLSGLWKFSWPSASRLEMCGPYIAPMSSMQLFHVCWCACTILPYRLLRSTDGCSVYSQRHYLRLARSGSLEQRQTRRRRSSAFHPRDYRYMEIGSLVIVIVCSSGTDTRSCRWV